MPLPQEYKTIAYRIISDTTADDRRKLADYLEEIRTDEELLCQRLKKTAKQLRRFNEHDHDALIRWLPIIERTLEGL